MFNLAMHNAIVNEDYSSLNISGILHVSNNKA